MVTTITRRILLLIPVIFGVVTLVFFTIHLIPGDPIDYIIGESAQEADKAILRADLGLDQPTISQYADYWKNLFHLNLGRSIHTNESVTKIIIERLPTTYILAISSMIVAIILALILGLWSASKPLSFRDHSAMLIALLGLSMPNFWLGPLLILLFSIHWDVFPVSGLDEFSGIILPSITLGTALAAILSRLIRTGIVDTMSLDFIRTARAKGLLEGTILFKHALRNAMLPTISVIGLQFGALFSGAIITEKVFNLEGLGTLLLDSIYQRNYPVLQGTILVLAISYVVINLITDLAYAIVDPRIRVST